MSAEDRIFAAAPDTGTVNADNPWPGLLPFREADQAWFQGRRAESGELLRLVMRERLTVFFGLSGLGKSSLLQAGLFPLLRQENVLPVYIRLDFSSRKPNLVAQVKEAIAREAAAAEVEAPIPREGETLWEYFHRRDADFWNRRNRPVVPLLVFDQFEEIFTLGRGDAEHAEATETFVGELAQLAEGSPPAAVEARLEEHPDEAELFSFGAHRYKLLLGIREDFLPDLEGLRSRMSAVALNRLRLCRMNGEAALLAVDQAAHLIDERVAEQVVRFVAASKGPDVPLAGLEVEPALLSVVCRELNNRRRELKEPKITARLLEGTQEEVLSDFYERSVADLPPEVRSFIEERLLTVSGYRDSVALENALSAPGLSREAINRLVERRLVRIEDRGGQRLELTHDLLVGVVRASRDRRREREAEERERRTLQQLRRSRLMAAAFLVLALVALGAAAAAVMAQRRAVAAQTLADSERAHAERTAVERQQAATAAAEAARVAELARVAATKSEAAAKRDRASAEVARADALVQARNAAEAAQQEASARKLAEDAGKKAVESADQAARQAAEADRQRAAAEAAQKAADAARISEKAQREKVSRSLAQSDVQDAARLVDIGQKNRALAYLARALRVDPTSMAAKSWIFDLLIRGSGPLPGEPLMREGSVYSFSHTPLQHQERVLSAVFSPEGRRLVTASWDNAAQVWEVESGTRAGPPLRHQGLVNSAVFSPEGRRVVTASQDGTAQVWNAESGSPVGQLLRHQRPVNSATFSPDGRRVVTASQDYTVRMWDAESGSPVGQPLRHERPVTSAAFSPDGLRVVTASWDNTAQVWDVQSGSRLGQPLLHKGQVNSAAFSPDGRRVVTASSDNTAQVWEEGRPVGEPMRHQRAVNSAAFSPDGRRVVTASDDNTARVWEADTGAPVGAPLRHKDRVNSASFSPDGRRVVTASYDKTALVWEVWFDFEDPSLLSNLAEALGGYQVERLPELVPLADPLELNKVRQLAERSPQGDATASFVRWFLTRPR